MTLSTAIGMRYSDGDCRRPIVRILLRKQWGIIGCGIDMSDAQWGTVSRVLGVSYDIPGKQRISIPDVFGGRGLRILNLLHSSIRAVSPEIITCCASTSRIIGGGGGGTVRRLPRRTCSTSRKWINQGEPKIPQQGGKAGPMARSRSSPISAGCAGSCSAGG